MKTARAVAGRTDFNAQLLNVDFTLPLHPRLTLKGEGWWGRGMSDVRGGAGQGINTANGREIRGRGGWGEAALRVSRYLTISPGFTTDDPVDQDLGNGARTRNRAFYLGDRISPSANFLIGADYLRWRTDYKGLLSGEGSNVTASSCAPLQLRVTSAVMKSGCTFSASAPNKSSVCPIAIKSVGQTSGQ